MEPGAVGQLTHEDPLGFWRPPVDKWADEPYDVLLRLDALSPSKPPAIYAQLAHTTIGRANPPALTQPHGLTGGEGVEDVLTSTPPPPRASFPVLFPAGSSPPPPHDGRNRGGMLLLLPTSLCARGSAASGSGGLLFD